MSIAAVAHKHAFGLKADVKGCIHWLDDTTAVYPSGANTVVYNAESRSQKFVPSQDSCDAMTAMALAPNKRFIAIAERSIAPPPPPPSSSSSSAAAVANSTGSALVGVGSGIDPGGIGSSSSPASGAAAAAAAAAAASSTLHGPGGACIVVYDLLTLRKRKVLVIPPPPAVAGGLASGMGPSDTSGGGASSAAGAQGLLAGATGGASNTSRDIISLSFSSDSKYIVCLTDGPDWMVYNWSWEKAKILGSVRCNASPLSTAVQVAFNPWDPSQVSVVGHGLFKMYRFVEGSMRQFGSSKVEPKHYLAHVWLNETRVIASTIDGHLILFESGEPKVDVVNTQGASGLHRDALSLVSTVKGGFICGCTGGLITIYDKTDEASYRKAREVVLPEEASQDIVAMALTPNEETLLVVGRNSQMYSVVLGEGDVKLEDTRFEPFAQPFHSGAVTGMDTCIRKPLIVTCSADRSVRVWNYMDASSELVKQFAEESYSVAFHPSGLYILVGFADKLRLMNLLIDDIRAFREFPVRGCREARFSNGGQYFAAVHGNVILVYNTWTFECLGTLKGHNGKVRSLSWSADDTRLVSAGAEGAMYEWNIREMRRESENILKSCSYSCAITSSGEGSRSIYAVGSDRTLKEIVDSQVVREIHTSTVLTQLVMSHSGRMMFAATTMGSIRSIKFPFASPNGTQLGSSGNSSGTSGGGVGATAAVGSAAAATAAALAVMSSNGQTATSAMEPGDFQEHKGHAGAVTRLRVSCDDVFLFSASDDGSVLVWKISDKEAAAAAGGSTGVTGAGAARAGVSFLAPTGAGGGSGAAAIRRDMVYADEILVTKTDLEDKTATMAELRARVEELKLENEYQLRLKDMNFHEKIKETTEKYQEEIDGLKITCAVLKADREKEEVRHDEEMAEETQRHSHSMDELEANHSSKLMAEYEKYQELQNKTAMLEQSWAQQLEELQQQKQLTLEEFTTQYEALLKNKQADIDQLQEEMGQQIKEFEETNRETEEDADSEILLLKHRYEKKLREEREVGLRLKGENGIMKKKFNTLSSEIDAHKGEIQKMALEEKKLHSIIKSLEKEIAGLKKEIQERDETIQDKEKRIYDLKKKNQELEKFKFVLDYKIKELKKQIEPREQDISEMSEQIKSMDSELSAYNKSNTDLDLMISDLKLKLKAAEKQVAVEKARVKYLNALVKQFKADLNACAAHIQDPKPLKQHVRDLYARYCSPEMLAASSSVERIPDLATGGAKSGGGMAAIVAAVNGDGDEGIDVANGGGADASSSSGKKGLRADSPPASAAAAGEATEQIRQRQYLERTIAGLRRAVSKDQTRHKADHVKIMQENVTLIREINGLRREIAARTGRKLAPGVGLNEEEEELARLTSTAGGNGETAASMAAPAPARSGVERLPAI